MSAEPIIDDASVDVQLAALVELLGIEPGEHVSINHEPPGGQFTSIVVRALDAPQKAASLPGSIWFGVNPTTVPVGSSLRGKAVEVARVVAFYLDLDFKDSALGCEANAQTLVDNLSVFGLPSAIVSTGGGLQPYWLLKGGDDAAAAARVLKRFHRFAKAMAANLGLGTIDNVSDVSRVLRVPGTNNHKYDPPRLVTMQILDDGDLLDLDDVSTLLDELGYPDEGEESTGQVVLAAGDWGYRDEGACPYVIAMVKGWKTDVPQGGRHPWLVSQATRLAAEHRYGCLSPRAHERASVVLGKRFGELCSQGLGGDERKAPKHEVRGALLAGVELVERKSDQEVADELAGHEHEEPFDPEAFWTSRESLQHVRAWALARRAGPLGTLGVVLARRRGAAVRGAAATGRRRCQSEPVHRAGRQVRRRQGRV